ncbi:STAS domain-containing protein [Streptomyces sp. ISL-12]|nr:STAS domain-containing protein [Streptomyces sp. ISL-12]
MSVNEAATGCASQDGTRRPRAVDGATVAQYEWRGARVIGARGAYDASSIEPLAQALAAAAEECPRVVLDASEITFADSALLNLLILTRRTVDLRVAAPARQVRRLLQLTGVDTLLTVRETVAEAAVC